MLNNEIGLMITVGFAGVGFSGIESLTLLYVFEISAERFRNFSSVILLTSWAAAEILYSGLSYLITNWRILCIAVIGFPLLLTVYPVHKYLLEAPRYLISRNMYD